MAVAIEFDDVTIDLPSTMYASTDQMPVRAHITELGFDVRFRDSDMV